MRQLGRWNLICAGVIWCVLLNGCGSLRSGENQQEPTVVHAIENEQKDTLFIFTGSDWSPEAEQFVKNVITSNLKTELEKKYSLRHIDLLRNPSEVERDSAQKNYLLFSEYAVPDVPFIVLQTVAQDIYAAALVEPEIKTGAELQQKIMELSVRRSAVIDARALIQHTAGAEKAKAIDSFLSTVYNAESRRYDSLRTSVPDLDPENTTGLKGKYLLMSADIRAKAAAYRGDFLTAGNEYKALAETGELAPAELQLAWYLAAYSYLMSGSIATQTVISYLQKAVQADPNSEGVAQIHQAIKKLQTNSR